MEVIVEIAKQNGVVAAIAIYLIYQTRKDYRGVCDRLNAVEDYVRNTLVELVKETTTALDRNAEAIRSCDRDRKR